MRIGVRQDTSAAVRRPGPNGAGSGSSTRSRRCQRGRIVAAGLLQGLPCLAYDEDLAPIRSFFAQAFGAPAAMRAVVTAPDLRIRLGMAEAGAGWTVLPDCLCADTLAAGRRAALPTDRPGPVNPLFLAWKTATLRHPRPVYVRDFLLRRAREF